MGRKSKIDNATLIALFEQYFMEKCEVEPGNIKIPAFAEYVRNNGYPDVQDYLIRRNDTLRKRISEIKENAENAITQNAVVFRNLDVEAFIKKNPTPASLKKALSERDTYYRNLSESASYCVSHFKEMSNKIDALMVKNTDLQEENARLLKELTSVKKERKKMDKVLKKFRELINTYLYPEIANELLKKEGLLSNTAAIVSEEILDMNVIHADTEVKPHNKIINNLFNKI